MALSVWRRRPHMKDLSSSERTGHGSIYTPWIDTRELRTVATWLYSHAPSDRRRGCQRVSGWQARGVIPFPVEYTADIVNCLLLKEEEESASGWGHGDVVSLSFAMFITKWVWSINGRGLLVLFIDLLTVCLISVVAMVTTIQQYITLLIK